MKTFRFQIVTQEKVAFDDNIESVTLPTKDGTIGVLAGHMPLLTAVVPGEMTIKKDGKNIYMAITGGFLEARPDFAVILADSADKFDELDEKKAEEAREKAEKLMQKKLSEAEMAETEAALQKALLHLKLIKKRKGRTVKFEQE